MLQPDIFGPLTIGGLTLRNRVMMSPMSQNSASADGEAGSWHLVHYGSRAVGGCGLILIEDTAIAESGRVSSRSLGLYADQQVGGLRKIVDFCKAQGAAVGIQIAHAGRKAYRDRKGQGIDLVSSSAVAFHDGWATPRAAGGADLREIVENFASAAQRAAAAGFDCIEIHAAHGYLLHQFLSPLVNTRTDHHGGSPENRSRLLLETLAAVRAVWPSDRPIFVRLPAADGNEGGLQRNDIVLLAAALASAGAQVIDVAGGNVTPHCASISAAEMQRAGEAIRNSVNLPVVVGGAESPQAARDMITRRACDLVAVGRPLLINPYWTFTASMSLGDKPAVPNQYALAFTSKEMARA